MFLFFRASNGHMAVLALLLPVGNIDCYTSWDRYDVLIEYLEIRISHVVIVELL